MDPFLPKSDWYETYWYSPQLQKRAGHEVKVAGRCRTAVNSPSKRVLTRRVSAGSLAASATRPDNCVDAAVRLVVN